MFEGWKDFYLLVGSAAAALIGLLFVVVSLTGGVSRDRAERGARLYLTPIVFHLGVLVVLSAAAMAPGLARSGAALIVGAAAALGEAYAVWIAHGIRRPAGGEPPHWSDFWCYGVAPAALYVALAAAAAGLWTGAAWAPAAEGAIAVALLLTAIRNAWDLATWLAPRAGGEGGAGGGEAG